MALFGTDTVDVILGDFTKTLEKLEARTADLRSQVADVTEKIAALATDRTTYTSELDRALTVSQKLKDFLST